MAFSALLSPSIRLALPFSYRAVRPPFGDLHGCPPPFGWRSRYRCVNLDVAVALPVPAVARASVRVFGSASVVPSCSAVALSARAVREFGPPACRPSVSSPAFVVIVAVAKALRSLDSLVYPPSAASSQLNPHRSHKLSLCLSASRPHQLRHCLSASAFSTVRPVSRRVHGRALLTQCECSRCPCQRRPPGAHDARVQHVSRCGS